MKTPIALPASRITAALAVVLALSACRHEKAETFFRASQGAPVGHAPPAASTDGPYIAAPVVVEAPEDASADADLQSAIARGDGPGREAALRYMRERAGTGTVAGVEGNERQATAPAPQPAPRTVAMPTPARAPVPSVSVAARPPGAAPAAPVVNARAAAPAAAARQVADVRTEAPDRDVAAAGVEDGLPPVAVSHDPDQAQSLNQRAIALINAGRPDEAVAVLERARAMQPRDAEMLGNLGYAYMLSGEHRKARASFMSALELAPTRSATWLNLGQTYAEMGDRDAGVDAVLKGYRYSTRKASVRSALQRAASSPRYDAGWREAAGLALSRIDGRS